VYINSIAMFVFFLFCCEHCGFVKCREALAGVNQQSAVPQLRALLANGTATLLYFGRFDLRDGIESAVTYIDQRLVSADDGRLLQQAAARRAFRVDGAAAGVVWQSSTLNVAQINGAGHFVPRKAIVLTCDIFF
jgi:hypothetical protein